jgi:ankyrin repeat protein
MPVLSMQQGNICTIARTYIDLHTACATGDIHMASLLLRNGADPHISNDQGETPLCIACRHKQYKIVHLLLEECSDYQCSFCSCMQYLCPLYQTTNACTSLYTSINDQTRYGCAPLLYVSFYGEKDIVTKLIHHGADVNQCNNKGESALSYACQEGHYDIVIQLITSGAHINHQRASGETPLCIACDRGHYNIMKKLIELGADLNLHRTCGSTPLYVACKRGYLNIVKELIASGADINVSRYYGATPLYTASEKGYLHIVKMLIKAGADAHKGRQSGHIPLHIASQKGFIDIVKILIPHTSSIDALTNQDATPLIIASCTGHTDIVQELIKYGADTHKRIKQGMSSLEIAVKKGHFHTACVLLQQHKNISKVKIPYNTIDHVNQENYTHGQINTQSRNHALLAYLMICKGADTSRLTPSYFTQKLHLLHTINKKHPHGSLSYAGMRRLINPMYHDLYLVKLCIDGYYESALRIIREKALSIGYTDAYRSKIYLMSYICRRIAPLLVITRDQMQTFVHTLHTYYRTIYTRDSTYMSLIIAHLKHIHNNLFIQTWAHLDGDIYINTVCHYEESVLHTIRVAPHQGVSLLEKAIRIDNRFIVEDLLNSEHINIDLMYAFFKACQKRDTTCPAIHAIRHCKKYARLIYHLKQYRDVYGSWIKTLMNQKKINSHINYDFIALYSASFNDANISIIDHK